MTHNRINYLERFHNNGLRFTRQRQTILQAICEAGGHAPFREIYMLAKTLDARIDRSTLYRALAAFIRLDLVNSAEGIHGERLYEIVREEPHHHLVCRCCGSEIEIENQTVQSFYRALQDDYDYHVHMDHLLVFGVCSHCST